MGDVGSARLAISKRIQQAFILVGGKGTRLGQLTRTIPKPLVEITEGRVFVDFVIEQLARQGFNEIVLLAGYLGHLVRQRYAGRRIGSASLQVLIEPTEHGTGGALLTAQEMLEPQFLLLNGDSFFDIDLRSLTAEATARNYQALLALHAVEDASRYGMVDLEGERIIRFREKNLGSCGPGLINAGVYVLARGIIDRIRSLPCSIETDVFPALAKEGKLAGIVHSGYFVDVGLPEALQRARQELPALQYRPAAFLDRDS